MRTAAAASILLVLAACQRDAQVAGHTVRDSAGVQLVTSTAPAWGATADWRVDTVPLLSIGDAASKNPLLLVEVNGVRLLSDGRIAIVVGDEHAVLYFDRQGKLLHRIGRDGSGPAEFRGTHLVGSHSDSLLIWDARLDRATLLDPNGKVSRTFALVRGDTANAPRYGFAPAAVFGDGSLLLAGRAGATTGDRSGLARDTIPLAHADATGHIIGGRIVAVPGNEHFVITTSKYVSMFERPFGRRTVTATHGARFFVGTGDTDGLTVYDTTGRITAQYLVDRPRHLIPASDIDAVGRKQGEQVAQLPKDFATVLRRVLLETGPPATLPTADQLVVDEVGALWLRDDVGPVLRDSISQRWTVLDSAGTWLGQVTLPRRLEVHQITADRIIGVWKDENDVEYVRVYRLTR